MKKLITLAFLCFSAVAVARNPFLSLEFQNLLEQAEENNAALQFEVGKRYYMGEGVPSDKLQGISWLEKSAKAGFIPAQRALGVLFLDGDGSSVPANANKGVEWLTKAAEKNDLNAMILLIALYKEGKLVPQDYAKAISWAEKGAVLGNREAQYYLGTFYHFGLGKEKDINLAAKLYTQAANQGHLDALNNIGAMYFGGIGVEKNQVLGYTYWLLAKSLGSSHAERNLQAKSGELSEQEKAKAENAVRRLVAQMNGEPEPQAKSQQPSKKSKKK